MAATSAAPPIVSVDQLKFDICCAARILFRAGMSAANAGHISVMIAPDRMLMNRFGPSFGTLHAARHPDPRLPRQDYRGPHPAEERAGK